MLVEIERSMQGPFGDRRQELVLIGTDVDEQGLRSKLDACLLTDAEMELGTEGWLEFSDPFEPWTAQEDLALPETH